MSEQEIDWKKENARAKKTGHFSKKAKQEIHSYLTCYVGERLNGLFPKEAFAQKMISSRALARLEYLGLRAAHMVNHDEVSKAIRTYREIQKIRVRRNKK
ncbi:MAG: hypothetical protein ACYC9R_13110 [Nitrosotalea sp.]